MNTMEELKKILSDLNEKSSKEVIQSTFTTIAEILLYKSHIVTAYGKYRMLEIEFYFFNSKHKDTVTIPRDEEPGMWWLHDWGVDISFRSEKKKDYYGGILIRSLYNEDNGDYLFGPKKCCWELFYSSAIKPTETPYIEEKTYVGKPGSNKRIISGDNKGVNEDYRYYVQEIDDKIVKNYKDSPWKNS